MSGDLRRYLQVFAVLLITAMQLDCAYCEETLALEVQTVQDSPEVYGSSGVKGESIAYEVIPSDTPVLEQRSLRLWKNISQNYRLAGDLLAHINHSLVLAGDDPAARLAVWDNFGPQLVETRNRLNQYRRIVDGRLSSDEFDSSTEELAYSVWQDDLYRVVSLLDNNVIVLDRDASFYREITSDVYEESFGSGVYESPMERTFWGLETQKPGPKPEWEFDLDMAWRQGTSTYSENESWDYELAAALEAAGGNEFEFYQSYSRDISYVESETFTIGAEQEFKNFLWDGDLEFSEEFSTYRDKSDDTNDYQEGEFKLGFDPEWNDGEWEMDFDYKYKVKVYETFSSRSHKLNSGKFGLKHEFSEDLKGEVKSSFDDYNYSIGSDRGNSKIKNSSSLDWDVTNDLDFSVEVSQEDKNYDVRKDRNYDKNEYGIDGKWKPDDDSQLSIDHSITDYDRIYDPTGSYEENGTRASYRRNLSDELDVDLDWSMREKNFDLDPLDDTEQESHGYGVNYNPHEDWNFSFSQDMADYGYADPVREYTKDDLRAGTRYSHGDVGISLDYSTGESSYMTDPLRDYVRDDWNLDFDYRLDTSSIRVYYGVGSLDQSDPASVNDYTETRVGASWDLELSDDADLSLSYDFNERDYDSQPLQEDNRLEARISIRF